VIPTCVRYGKDFGFGGRDFSPDESGASCVGVLTPEASGAEAREESRGLAGLKARPSSGISGMEPLKSEGFGRGFYFSGLLQNLEHSGGGRAEECFGAHRRNLFSNGHIDELVQGHAFGLGHPARRVAHVLRRS
jgi:hypothetical protein